MKEAHLKFNVIGRWKVERWKKDIPFKKLFLKAGVITLTSDKVDSGQINLLKTKQDNK